MPVDKGHEILRPQRVNNHMDSGEGWKILFFLQKQNRLFQGVGNPAANFIPEITCRVLHIFNFGQQNLIKLADFQFDHMEALCLEGDQLHAFARNMQNGLRLGPFIWWQSGIEIIGQSDLFQFHIDRVQVRGQKDIRPLAHSRLFGIADDHTRQIVIFRTN